ncbi:DUF3885 domain-containing protein [Chromobacterium violaceum]|uniref:DUF3885 domain-containing protein n=1 Tax=Chromobacterium violaceum TaxID=536 RepID=UPI001B324D05|nr:DUF3885 domain-containing protein [Chromobacterium violaceum]MBP4047301.1 DUF3885 domain-containing protein [Chromobacterium violaceum]
MKISKIKEIFGENCFSNAVFYKYKDSLRFEISQDDNRLNQFITAYENAKNILNSIFKNDFKIYCSLSLSGEHLLSALSQFKEIKHGGFTIPNLRSIESEIDENEKVIRIIFQTSKEECTKLLWMKLAYELGISPSMWFDLHIFNIEEEIFIHPYDERGIDIIGKKSNLKVIFNQIPHLLLKYDMGKMENSFK